MRLELAADYLVMAAWLAYLKSRLLLPEPPKGEEPSAADLATALALRLRRLEAIREAARKLGERDRLGRDVFARGAPGAGRDPTGMRATRRRLYDLLSAYARQRQKQFNARVTLHKRQVWSLVDAREALERLVGHLEDWVTLDGYLVDYMVEPSMRADRAGLRLVRHPGDGARGQAVACARTRLSRRSGSGPCRTGRGGGLTWRDA